MSGILTFLLNVFLALEVLNTINSVRRPAIKLIYKPQQGFMCYKPGKDSMIFQVDVNLQGVRKDTWPHPFVLEILRDDSSKTKPKNLQDGDTQEPLQLCKWQVVNFGCYTDKTLTVANCSCKKCNNIAFTYMVYLLAANEYDNVSIRVRTDRADRKDTEFSPTLKTPFVIHKYWETLKVNHMNVPVKNDCVIPMESLRATVDFCVYYLRRPYTIAILHGNNQAYYSNSEPCATVAVFYNALFPEQNKVHLSFQEKVNCNRRKNMTCIMKDVGNKYSTPGTNIEASISSKTSVSGSKFCILLSALIVLF